MQQSFAQTFNETAAAAYAAFPRELRGLAVVITDADTPVFVSPEIAEHLTKNIAGVKEVLAEVTDILHKKVWSALASPDYPVAGVSVKLIALNPESRRAFLSERYTQEMRLAYILDHEIGHHILSNGMFSLGVSAQQCESAADAFATLRHIQRYGKDTDNAGGEAGRVAHRLVLCADSDHYTSGSIERAIEVADEIDISNLSLRETVALAEKISRECYFRSDFALRDIVDAFRPVYDACKTNIGGVGEITEKFYGEDKEAYALFCRETLAVMRNHQNEPNVFKAGKRFLSYAPVKKFMMEESATETGNEWKRALDFINTHKPAVNSPQPEPSSKDTARRFSKLWQRKI